MSNNKQNMPADINLLTWNHGSVADVVLAAGDCGKIRPFLPEGQAGDQQYRKYLAQTVTLLTANHKAMLHSVKPHEIILLVKQAVSLKLDLMSDCYILAFGKQIALVINPAGMYKLMYRDPRILRVVVSGVYKDENIEYDHITGEMKHDKKIFEERSSSDLVGFYATASIVRCENHVSRITAFVSMTECYEKRDAALSKIFDKNKHKFSPWVTHFTPMCEKTALRKLFKILPIENISANANDLYIESASSDKNTVVAPKGHTLESSSQNIANQPKQEGIVLPKAQCNIDSASTPVKTVTVNPASQPKQATMDIGDQNSTSSNEDTSVKDSLLNDKGDLIDINFGRI